MPGPVHRITRWLRLGLTTLALALGAVPAQALPAARTEVTLSVEQHESPRQCTVNEASVQPRRAERRALPLHARAESPSRVPKTRPPGPPRPLFIAHRALLR